MNIYLILSSIKAPHDLWTILLDWIQGGFGNIGWALLFLTILVKLATSPLDFLVKWSTKKQTLVQQKCAPEIAKLTKKFGNDKRRLQMQTQSVYKREGLRMGTGCIIMLVNMILTMTIFFSFYGTLRNVSAYNTINQYEQIVEKSTQSFNQAMIDFDKTDEITSMETLEVWYTSYNEAKAFIDNPENNDKTETTEYKNYQKFVNDSKPMIDSANEAFSKTALETWNGLKSKWLWVQNIWVADATTSPFPTYDGLVDIAGDAGKYYKQYVKENITEADYNKVAGIIHTSDVKYNGYFILAILAGVITFLSQIIADLHNKLKSKKANTLAKATNQQNQMSMKMIKIIMPIIMVMFVITSSASFGIHILASNIASIAVGEVIKLFVNLATKKQQAEVVAVLEKEANRLIKKGKLQ